MGGRVSRTISSVDLGQGSGGLAQQDRGLGVVLLHGRVGAGEERTAIAQSQLAKWFEMRAAGPWLSLEGGIAVGPMSF